jgi:hypothetical protein
MFVRLPLLVLMLVVLLRRRRDAVVLREGDRGPGELRRGRERGAVLILLQQPAAPRLVLRLVLFAPEKIRAGTPAASHPRAEQYDQDRQVRRPSHCS